MPENSEYSVPTELPFSAATRALHWEALGDETFDLLVIGGGITGAGVARDAAGRGLSVALVEAGDFAQGTSSRSSRLIHGGLRYLETFDFGLVFEASAERKRLLELAPHLVRPLPFLFPVYRGNGVGLLKLRAGMWLYDALSLFRNIRGHRMRGQAGVLQDEPHLRREGLKGGAIYYDAQVDDARLTSAVMRAAHDAGARTVSHAEVIGFLKEESRIRGARVRDSLSGEVREVRARLVINATGPWSDEVRRLADPSVPSRLRPTKGIHLVASRSRVGNTGAIIFPSFVDGRVMFVLPWGDLTYIGTTDTDLHEPPGDARAEPEDVRYLLNSVNALFPEAHLTEEDVISTWTGVRPLLAPEESSKGGVSAGQTSREHDVWRDESGLLNIGGGKLTTYRVMAADAVEAAAEILAREHGVESGDYYTEVLPLPDAPDSDWDTFLERTRSRAARMNLGAELGEHLASAYGSEADSILDAIERAPELGERILSDHPYLWAEVPHVVRHEMALTLEDVLRRRLHLLYEAEDGGLEVAPAVARRMAGEEGIGWDEGELQKQLAQYRRVVEKTRSFRTGFTS